MEMKPAGFKIDNGWQYSFDPNQTFNKILQVISEPKKEVPEYLYKYYSWSPLNIDALKKNYLYASNKFEINDDFDCLEQLIDFRNTSDDVLIDFYLQFNHTKEEIEGDIESFRQNYPIHKAINYYGGFGIISLSENIVSPTMWAHYANSNSGFAIKFNLNHFHEHLLGPFPINYKANWFPIKSEEFDERLSFLYMTNIKSIHWEYEQEWRYIGAGRRMSFPPHKVEEELIENRKFKYSEDAIEEIIFGHRFIQGFNKYNCNDNLVLVQTPDVKFGGEKIELLHFIVEKGIKTSRVVLKEGSDTFELDTKPVEIKKIDKYSFQMKI